jgi:hypothetical protein
MTSIFKTEMELLFNNGLLDVVVVIVVTVVGLLLVVVGLLLALWRRDDLVGLGGLDISHLVSLNQQPATTG